jgi:quinol monooxygenase YgiN
MRASHFQQKLLKGSVVRLFEMAIEPPKSHHLVYPGPRSMTPSMVVFRDWLLAEVADFRSSATSRRPLWVRHWCVSHPNGVAFCVQVMGDSHVVRLNFLVRLCVQLGAMTVCMAAMGASLVHADCDEVAYIATFEVTPGSEQAFEQAIVNLANKVVEVEDGVVLYAPFRGADGRYYMMERYKNLAAQEVHAKSDEVIAMFPAVMGPLSAPIAVESLTAVCGS